MDWLKKYENGGKATSSINQNNRKDKKSIIFTESPEQTGNLYNLFEPLPSSAPSSLIELQKKYNMVRSEEGNVYNQRNLMENYLTQYLKGYTGENVTYVTPEEYITQEGVGYPIDDIANLPPFKKYKNLEERFQQLSDSCTSLNDSFYSHPDNSPIKGSIDQTFNTEGNKLKEWYKKQNKELDIIPIYGLQDTTKVNSALKNINLQDVGIMGHSGGSLGGIPLSWWNKKLGNVDYENCILGTCYGASLIDRLPDVKNIYHTSGDTQWSGVNTSADTLEKALFSTRHNTKINPKRGEDYNISHVRKNGGEVNANEEYISIPPNFIGSGYDITPRRYSPAWNGQFVNGGEMKYYQEGLDFKPNSISRDGSELQKLDQLVNFNNFGQNKHWLNKYLSYEK